MQAERWKKIEELYQAALAHPSENRAEFPGAGLPGGAAIADRIPPGGFF